MFTALWFTFLKNNAIFFFVTVSPMFLDHFGGFVLDLGGEILSLFGGLKKSLNFSLLNVFTGKGRIVSIMLGHSGVELNDVISFS